MTRDDAQMQQKGNVLIVGTKLDSSGRELLTWTLAKFTNAGDHVIALHIASSSSKADALRSDLDSSNHQAEAVFDSFIGVYESFCSIKKVDLQVKVANGPSLRRALIDETKKVNAVRLILGHAPSKSHIGPSFSLAKYCSKRLPTTCSVTVIQHGQVAFEKEGVLRNPGDSSGVLSTIQKKLQSHSWKNPGQRRLEGRSMSVSSRSSETEVVQDENGTVACYYWPLPTRFLDSPISVLHANYKCASLHTQCMQITLSELESPSSGLSSPTDLFAPQSHAGTDNSGGDDGRTNQARLESSHSTLEECFAQSYADLHCERGNNKAVSPLCIQGTVVQNCAGLVVDTDKPVEGIAMEMDGVEDGILPSLVGWPLLRRAIPIPLEDRSQSIRKMSVVEWALQLPDRPREGFIIQQGDLPVNYTPNSSPLTSSEGSSFEEHRSEEVSGVCVRDDLVESPADTVALRLAKLSHQGACKQFQFVDLQTATGQFNSDNIVGKGGCSKVYRGVLADGHVVAVKCLKASALDSVDEFVSEVEIMSSLCHNHIVRLIGYCVDSEHYMLVYTFASEGNLEQKLYGGKGKAGLSWEARCKIAVGVAEALKYLHNGCTRLVIHRDVKSSNILLSSDLKPQLTDFGLAKRVLGTSTQITCSDVVGTFGYLAPEYFMFGKVSEKTDVYSFGVVLLELITGRSPIDSTKPKGRENLVIWARPLLEDELSLNQLIDPKLEGLYNASQLKSMMVAAALCLRQSPQMRPRMSRILKLLRGEIEDLEHAGRQDHACKESDDGCDMPNYGDIDMRTHLTLALYGLDDDAASQASIDQSVELAHSNKYLEEYLGGRYSRSSSFE